MRIPNWITLPALIGGLLLQLIINGWQGLLFSLCGSGAGFLLLLIMYFIGAVGAGDVKLFCGYRCLDRSAILASGHCLFGALGGGRRLDYHSLQEGDWAQAAQHN
ncbi:prepilin peptidase [Paenibacillus rhizoplanae]